MKYIKPDVWIAIQEEEYRKSVVLPKCEIIKIEFDSIMNFNTRSELEQRLSEEPEGSNWYIFKPILQAKPILENIWGILGWGYEVICGKVIEVTIDQGEWITINHEVQAQA